MQPNWAEKLRAFKTLRHRLLIVNGVCVFRSSNWSSINPNNKGAGLYLPLFYEDWVRLLQRRTNASIGTVEKDAHNCN